MKLSFWDLLHYIVENPPPELPQTFSPEFRDFVSLCLQKEPEKRAKVTDLLAHPFCTKHQGVNVSDLLGSSREEQQEDDDAGGDGGDGGDGDGGAAEEEGGGE